MNLQSSFLLSISMLMSVNAYYEGPLWGMFHPKQVKMVAKCDDLLGNACLKLPTKQECRVRLERERKPCEPPPWWYLYCQMITAPRPTIRTTTTTNHPFYKKMLDDILLTLQISATIAKKKHRRGPDSSQLRANSDESIENLLYYKDCKHKQKDASPAPMMLRNIEPTPPREPACPCPRMCCSMCCDCNAPMPFVGRQMAPLQTAVEPLQVAPQPPHRMPPQMMVQPQIMQRAAKKKKSPKPGSKPPAGEIQPIDGRRDFGFTRENIKSLISHDQDIKKILKDLVRVTMRKVDLVEQVNARRMMEQKSTTQTAMKIDQDEDYYYD